MARAPASRVEKLARILVEYSAHIRKGDRVLIESEPVAEPLIRALYKYILQAGGHPHLELNLGGQLSKSGVDTVFFEHASDEQLDYIPPLIKHVYDTFESLIRVHALPNTRALTGADPAKQARRSRTLEPILQAQFTRGARGEFKWVTTLFPTQAYAQDAEMSLSEYEDFVFGACHAGESDEDPVAYWQLQAEMHRIARQTKQPELLREQWRALNNDPQLIAEMQVRPLLADRLLRAWYGRDERIHGEQYGPVRRCWCGVSILSCWIHPSTAIPPQPTTGLAPLYSALRMRAADSRAYGLEQS